MIVGLIGIKFLSEWKENIKTFATTIAAVLTVIMVDLALIPFLTPYTIVLALIANIVGFSAIIGAIVWFWYRRIPKIDLREAETIALKHIRAQKEISWLGLRPASDPPGHYLLDTKYLGGFDGKNWRIPIIHLGNEHIIVEVDGKAGEPRIKRQ